MATIDYRKMQRIVNEWSRAKKNKTLSDLVSVGRTFGCRIEETKEGLSFWPENRGIGPVHVPNPHPQKEVKTGYVSQFVQMLEEILLERKEKDGDDDGE